MILNQMIELWKYSVSGQFQSSSRAVLEQFWCSPELINMAWEILVDFQSSFRAVCEQCPVRHDAEIHQLYNLIQFHLDLIEHRETTRN